MIRVGELARRLDKDVCAVDQAPSAAEDLAGQSEHLVLRFHAFIDQLLRAHAIPVAPTAEGVRSPAPAAA